MERTPIHEGGEHVHEAQVDEPATNVLPAERLSDEQLIHYYITEALREDRPIDHATARAIAAQLHGGQSSLLYALASTGAVVDGVRAELSEWHEQQAGNVEVEPWLDALDEYLVQRGDPNPVEGWHNLWPQIPIRALSTVEDDVPAYESVEHIVTTGVLLPLGQMATANTVVLPNTADADGEIDDLPWNDAAEWRAADALASDLENRQLPPEQLDELFAMPDEQVGSVEDLGWYGLVRHADRPGGYILRQNSDGFRRVQESPTDEALAAQWAVIEREHDWFVEQREAYELATRNPATTSGEHPQVWVGSLSDYSRGNLYGVWLNAALEPNNLENAVAFMLRTSPSAEAEEWAIFDFEGFGGYQVSEYSNLRDIARVAQGIAEHGQAFGEWAELVGSDSADLLTDEAFRDHYRGEWESMEAYVENMLEETGVYEELNRAIPDTLRYHVTVDLKAIGEEWEQGLHVVDAPGGGVFVFDADV